MSYILRYGDRTLATMSFNEYTQIALIIKQNQELKEKIKKLEKSVNNLWEELTDTKDSLDALEELYSKHVGEY